MGSLPALLIVLLVLPAAIYPLTRAIKQHVFTVLALVYGVTFALTWYAQFTAHTEAPNSPTTHLHSVLADVVRVPWLPQLGFDLSLRLDSLSWLFALLVSGVGALVLLYCRFYFTAASTNLPRFAAVFSGFAASMYGLVLADNVYLLVCFWEATSVLSFLLIGHFTAQRASRASAMQALLVTSLGGLAMLVGFVLLAAFTGTTSLQEQFLQLPDTISRHGGAAVAACYLVLVGALSKSAIFPFHFWLPGAMAAPTPVSAYLHAAAMVKAGIYLVSRLVFTGADLAAHGYHGNATLHTALDPASVESTMPALTPALHGEIIPGLTVTLVLLGGVTMLLGGVKALRMQDAKLAVAYGTVSQLGFLLMAFGVASFATMHAEADGAHSSIGPLAVAATALLLTFAHALAKAPLFLLIGAVDKAFGTRDMRRLRMVGPQHPVLAGVFIIATASMIGAPPLLGFVAKEQLLGVLLAPDFVQVSGDTGLVPLAQCFTVIGSVLTTAYMVRLAWGLLVGLRPRAGRAADVAAPAATQRASLAGLVFPAAVLALLTFVSVVLPTLLSETLSHGVTMPLLLSFAILAFGGLLAWATIRGVVVPRGLPERFGASHIYWNITHGIDVFAVRLTRLTQRGSLPWYLGVILATTIVGLGVAAVRAAEAASRPIDWASDPAQVVIALLVVLAALYAVRAHTRFQAVVLVGVTGAGMSAIFLLHGAPDLALTQVLVETVTLIAIVLVIRRLPQHIGVRVSVPRRLARLVIAIGTAGVLGAGALVALAARTGSPVSLLLPELAHEGGHGSNVVNVTLVDIRGWDTLGEISVLLAAATGVASLIFLRTRVDHAPKLGRSEARQRVAELLRRVADPNDPVQRRTWMLAGRSISPSHRSIILEVVTRLIFHALIVLSLYLLLVGHNAPGGGFAGGLTAGLALVVRYLAGGREELRATVPVDAGRILGVGLVIAVLCAALPVLFGQSALASTWVDLHLGPLGSLSLVSSALFDVGVYLVVFGLVLDVLRSLGAEIDEQEESDAASGQVAGAATSAATTTAATTSAAHTGAAPAEGSER